MQFVSSNLSSKILREALEQQHEIDQEEASEDKRSELAPSSGFSKYEEEEEDDDDGGGGGGDDDENDSDSDDGVSEACTQFDGDVRHWFYIDFFILSIYNLHLLSFFITLL